MSEGTLSAPPVALEETDQQGISKRLRTWHSSVSVVICYHDRQLSLTVPRLSYIPLAFSKIRRTFELSSDQELYFSSRRSNNVRTQAIDIISVHLPVGLLYDIYGENHPFILCLLTDRPNTDKGSPYAQIQQVEDLHSYLWNSTKQNEVIRQNSVRRIQNLTPQQTKDFYLAMLRLDFMGYWQLAQTFMNTVNLRHYPVRIHLCIVPTDLINSRRVVTIQNLVPVRIQGHSTTVVNCVQILLPRWPKDSVTHANLVVILHGRVVEWQESMEELLEEEQYADGWLYLTIKEAVKR